VAEWFNRLNTWLHATHPTCSSHVVSSAGTMVSVVHSRLSHARSPYSLACFDHIENDGQIRDGSIRCDVCVEVSLLQPLKDHATIGARLDALDELLRAGDTAGQLRKHLHSLPNKDIDKVIAQFAPPRGRSGRGQKSTTAVATAATALTRPPDAIHVSGLIKTLLGMRATLAAVPLMGTLLKDVEAPLLVEIGEVLRGGFFGGGLA